MLSDIFAEVYPWDLMKNTIKLDDSASYSTVINSVLSQKSYDKKLKTNIASFFSNFYPSYFQMYYEKKRPFFEQKVLDLQKQVDISNADIISFMESISGQEFQQKLKPVFYYSFRPIGAIGIDTDKLAISTLQCNVNDIDYLFDAPFHEFTHTLFLNFNKKKPFLDLCNSLKRDNQLYNSWILNYKKIGYTTWESWCEENLVEGFAHYLTYKYYGRKPSLSTYVFDYDFYVYLAENAKINSNLYSLTIEYMDILTKTKPT
jgi:hypothetical protein